MSSWFSHQATNTVATALPNRLVSARPRLMKRSIASTSTMPVTGTLPFSVASVAASVMNPPPVTAAAPFEVNNNTARMTA